MTQVGQDFIQFNTSADCDECSHGRISASLIYEKKGLCPKPREDTARHKGAELSAVWINGDFAMKKQQWCIPA